MEIKQKIFLCFAMVFVIGSVMISANIAQKKTAIATFAGGCFWCIESAFEDRDGVIDVVSGYMGGIGENPTYADYAQKGYVEAVQIQYNPDIITYAQLLDILWKQINPTDAEGQFVDRGPQYRSVIFYHNQEQKQEAEQSKQKLQNSGHFDKKIVTELLPAMTFYKAEEYHQNYAKKHPWKYKFYRYRSGRDQFLQSIWGNKMGMHKKKEGSFGKPLNEELQKKLTKMQYYVTQQNGTEPPFNNAYWNNYAPGIYVDIVSGEPLFSSKDKYKSGTGWPSFTKPLEQKSIVLQEDRGWFSTRIEVRSAQADSHLGHVFNDGPPPHGLRYCINSAALLFIPLEQLERKGYERYLQIFQSDT